MLTVSNGGAAGWVRMAALALSLGFVPAAAGGQPMTPIERQHLLAHLEMTGGWLVDEVTGLSPEQLTFKPSPDSWSIGQVLDHLILVAQVYWDDLHRALKSPPAPDDSAFSDADVLWYGIDRSNRERAIPTEVPTATTRALAEAVREYRRYHDRLVEYVRTTSDPLRRHRVPRQGSDAYQWVLLISTHEQRHILQIREIKAARGFPRQ